MQFHDSTWLELSMEITFGQSPLLHEGNTTPILQERGIGCMFIKGFALFRFPVFSEKTPKAEQTSEKDVLQMLTLTSEPRCGEA